MADRQAKIAKYVKKLTFEDLTLNCYEIGGKPFFNLNEVAGLVEVSQPQAIKRRLSKDDMAVARVENDKRGGFKIKTFINFLGLVTTMVRSQSDNAESLLWWILDDLDDYFIKKIGFKGLSGNDRDLLSADWQNNEYSIDRLISVNIEMERKLIELAELRKKNADYLRFLSRSNDDLKNFVEGNTGEELTYDVEEDGQE